MDNNKLRTIIEPQPLHRPIDVGDGILMAGSCFTQHIGQWLSEAWLPVCCNPWGILFNPASIARSLDRIRPRNTEDYDSLHKENINLSHIGNYTPQLTELNGRWYSFDHHGSLCRPTHDETRRLIRDAEQQARQSYLAADHIVVTFGTAWVFEREGEVVANCHRFPATDFVRRRLSVEEIVELWSPLIANKHWIMTVSPIRHVADTLHGNQLSKATLLLAIDELRRLFPEQVEYLPIYELLIDDLRDYRFYADDLVHPAPIAIRFVKDYFSANAMTPRLRQYMAEAEPIIKGFQHRPSDPESASHLAFLSQLEQRKRDLIAKYRG